MSETCTSIWTNTPVKLKVAFDPCNPHDVEWSRQGHITATTQGSEATSQRPPVSKRTKTFWYHLLVAI
jgi:hypothetical protein